MWTPRLFVTRPLAAAFAAASLVAWLPGAAQAVPAEDTTRIALQAGWRYQPNGRFAEWTAMSGYPMTSKITGGPTLLFIFAYRPMPEIEVALEVGWAFERFSFENAKPMQLNQIPITAAVRYAPFAGSIFPYVGVGYGYMLNFFTDAPGGTVESHGSTPVLIAGGSLELSDRISINLEYRYTLCRVELTNLGYMQAGGNSLYLGVSLAFPPEDKRRIK